MFLMSFPDGSDGLQVWEPLVWWNKKFYFPRKYFSNMLTQIIKETFFYPQLGYKFFISIDINGFISSKHSVRKIDYIFVKQLEFAGILISLLSLFYSH